MEYNYRIDDRGLTYLVTYYTKYCTTKSSHVFMFGFLRTATSAQRIYRLTSKLIQKALPSTKDAKLWEQGTPTSWFTDRPRLPKKIIKTRARKPEDLASNEILSRNLGVRDLTDAPPSAHKRENSNVHKLVQRENQTEGKSV